MTSACEAAMRDECAFDDALRLESSETTVVPDAPLEVSLVAPVGRRYLWRVRACDAEGCSAWSDVWYLDVGRAHCDVNGDGHEDLIAGAPDEPAFAGSTGWLYVFYGPTRDATNHARLTFPAGRDSFASSVACAGDVNGDGFGDLVVGAPYADVEGVAGAGSAFAVYGHSGSLDQTDVEEWVRPGPEAGARVGMSVAGGGDINDDGFADVLVGAPFANGARGVAYAFLGSSSGIDWSAPMNLGSPSPSTDGYFGASVAVASDLDADGIADIAVGAPGETALSVAGAGAVHVSLSGSTGAFERLVSSEPTNRGSFGLTLSSGADVNGDLLEDLVVGAPRETTGAVAEGAVHVIAGNPSGPSLIQTLRPPSALGTEHGFGGRVFLAHLDAGPQADLIVLDLVGAPDGSNVLYGFTSGGMAEPLNLAPERTLVAMGSGDLFGVSATAYWPGTGDAARVEVGEPTTDGALSGDGAIRTFEGDVQAPQLQSPVPASSGLFGYSIATRSSAVLEERYLQ